MSIKRSKGWKFFSSIKLAIWLLASIATVSIIGTLILQNKSAAEYISRYGHSTYKVFSAMGFTHVYSAWWFILLLGLLSLNLTVCLLNRFSLKLRSLGTTIAHLSVLVIFAGALVGMFFGQKGFVKIYEGQSIGSFESHGKKVSLDFSVRLNDFIYEENISPDEKIVVSSEDGSVLEEVSVEIGTEAKIPHTENSIKVLRYVPDFILDVSTKKVVSRSSEPRNPAVEIELNTAGETKTLWVFARYPDIHNTVVGGVKIKYVWAYRRPKDFISNLTVIKDGKEVLKQDVRVNCPLKFGGYTFFQSSYDKTNLVWTGLQVVKDPGVPIVYLGFVLLVLGLGIRFYVNPMIK